ncbi:hypothetical protein trd_A0556 (plasmid) [Thermomicrobium roseum DSM 5159]|uniref:Uncharacterized protein n=1 Tax=Thermomicrobium roseum (strain ATCC 27502 / DSM 5159 / P-2) TaxID=309801 RepID=B9L442_THERP|nr:hypothetical protein trd_A0556 [Thermomicrobium roseum DSM 5159]
MRASASLSVIVSTSNAGEHGTASEQSLRQAALPWPAKLHARPRIAYN